MGSFATSLHIKSTNADGVAAALKNILAADDWRPTDKELDADASWGASENLRGVHITSPRDGWVGILDSDLMGGHALTSRLAQQLQTPAIFFFVNDSDSWSYLLADGHGATSEFDSEELPPDDDEEAQMVNATAAISQIQSLMQDGSVMQKMQSIQERMSASAPPDIRAAEERIKTGRGTTADMQQYQAWAMQEMPKHMADMRSMLGGLLGLGRAASSGSGQKKSSRKQSKAQRTAWQKRLADLRPLLAKGVTDEQVQAVMEKRELFAEEVLREFLPLLGIAGFFANLSYRYLDGTPFDDLLSENIHFSHHLRFETPRPRHCASA